MENIFSRLQIAGDYDLIQCPEISSTTERCRFPLLPPRPFPQAPSGVPAQHFPRCRPSYRAEPPPGVIVVESSDEDVVAPSSVSKGKMVRSTKFSLLCLSAIFTLSLFILVMIYSTFPELTAEEKKFIKIPWNFEDAKQLGAVLNRYKEAHYFQVYIGVCIAYIFLQTFAIPGSLFLSVLSGFLFSFLQALALVCTCSALGATLCFMISQLVGRRLIFKYFPEKAASWGETVEKHRHNLLNYVIFLRVTPFLPNWFINLTAPVIGVPLMPFMLGTFIGVAPPSFIALQAGKTLNSMSSTDNPVSWTSMAALVGFGILSLVPVYYKDRLKEKFE